MQSNRFQLFLTIAGLGMLVTGVFLWGQRSQQQAQSVDGQVVTATQPSNLGMESEEPQLQVPLDETVEEQKLVVAAILANGTFFLRDIYEKSIGVIGANGLINAVHTADPTCHDRGHDLGKVIYARLQNIGSALRTCEDACYSGCMHGVLMEAFGGDDREQHEHSAEELDFHFHVDFDQIKASVEELCSDPAVLVSYPEGDCLHGVGHALMTITDYDVPETIKLCEELYNDGPRRYYCATGAFMEYNNINGQRDYETKPLFYPCDENKYPGACFRYKLVPVFAIHYRDKKSAQALIEKCLELDRYHRLGCFHGVGNANMPHIVREQVDFEDICNFGSKDDQYMCIEGAIERMAKYHPDIAPMRCDTLQETWKRELCNQGVANGMYSLDKPFDLYL